MPLQILRKSVPASREAITGLAEMLKCGCTEPELVKDALMSAEHPRFPEIMLELLQSENPQVRAIAEEVASVRLNTLWFLRRAAPLCPYMRKYVTGKLIGGNGVQRLFAAKILLDSGDVSSIRVLESAVEMEGARGGLQGRVMGKE
jgi:hypothetical protein